MEKENFEIMQTEMQKISKNLIECINNYNNYIKDATLDVPIEVLCLPDKINDLLHKNDLFRVGEIISLDLTKIEGLHQRGILLIQKRLRDFGAI